MDASPGSGKPGRKDFRHEISYQTVVTEAGGVYLKPVCTCGTIFPAFWSRQRAEEAGIDHQRSIKTGRKERK